MNSMNDERFFDLAMKVIARQATDAQRAELDDLLTSRPELKAEYERLQAEVKIAKETLPLVNATEATAGEFPAYARGRLQTKVRQTIGRPQTAGEPKSERERSLMWTAYSFSLSPRRQEARSERERGLMWAWRWALGLTMATAVVLLLILPTLRPSNEPVIQVAMLDVGGATRGGDVNEAATLRQTWEKATVDVLSGTDALRAWEANWPAGKQPIVKIIYDRAAGEVRVVGRRGGSEFKKTFPVESELVITLKHVREFIREQTGR